MHRRYRYYAEKINQEIIRDGSESSSTKGLNVDDCVVRGTIKFTEGCKKEWLNIHLMGLMLCL
jgi:hypothetical protein